MNILTENNEVLDTDVISRQTNYTVLSFEDNKNPDFYSNRIIKDLEDSNGAVITLNIGPFECILPMHWSILCTDYDKVDTIPLHELSGRNFLVFCVNPISGYKPSFFEVKTGISFSNANWTSPVMAEKDLLAVPIGMEEKTNSSNMSDVKQNPICAFFATNKIDINRPISDIW